MDKRGRGKGGIVIIILIIIGLLVWGYIGGQNNPNLSACNIHFGIFCWKWGTNAVSQAGGTVSNLVNGSSIPT